MEKHTETCSDYQLLSRNPTFNSTFIQAAYHHIYYPSTFPCTHDYKKSEIFHWNQTFWLRRHSQREKNLSEQNIHTIIQMYTLYQV